MPRAHVLRGRHRCAVRRRRGHEDGHVAGPGAREAEHCGHVHRDDPGRHGRHRVLARGRRVRDLPAMSDIQMYAM